MRYAKIRRIYRLEDAWRADRGVLLRHFTTPELFLFPFSFCSLFFRKPETKKRNPNWFRSMPPNSFWPFLMLACFALYSFISSLLSLFFSFSSASLETRLPQRPMDVTPEFMIHKLRPNMVERKKIPFRITRRVSAVRTTANIVREQKRQHERAERERRYLKGISRCQRHLSVLRRD